MRRHGFSLIEAAIVLGIVGLVIGGIWVAATSVREKNKAAEVSKDIGLMLEGAKRYLASNRSLTGLDGSTFTSGKILSLKALHMLPPDCVNTYNGTGGYVCNSTRYPWTPNINISSTGLIEIGLSAHQPPAAWGSSFFSAADCVLIGKAMAETLIRFKTRSGGVILVRNSGSASHVFYTAEQTHPAHIAYTLSALMSACGANTDYVSIYLSGF